MSEAARFPELATRGLGMGMDLRWGGPVGFIPAVVEAGDGAGDSGSDVLSPALRAFLTAEAPAFAHVFFSWQPRDRARLKLGDYAPAWDDLASALPAAQPRALHHTALNLAAEAPVDRSELFDFTNALCQRYRLRWINEDVGFWSVAGRPVPYPLPPVLDAAGLAACVRNVRACQRGLVAPLVLEFPGFAAGVSLVAGDVDAYDFFRALADETGAPVTLDVAHLLSWRWWRGFRGQGLYGDLDRLPLDACFEVHLSGCEIDGDRFVDAHHGRLLDQQLALLELLLPACPNLRAITFEDPRLDERGALDRSSAESLRRLRAIARPWAAAPDAATTRNRKAAPPPNRKPAPTPPTPSTATDDGRRDGAREQTLASLLFDAGARAARRDGPAADAGALATLDATELEAAASAARAMVRDRGHRGTGRLADMFPRCVAGWRAAHPEDVALDDLFARFLSAPEAAAWREHPGVAEVGACIEECFASFAAAADLAPAGVCEDELLSAVLRTLTVSPDPAFRPPPAVRRCPGGWFAVTTAGPAALHPVLYAALGGRYLRGQVTPLIATLLAGATAGEAAARSGTDPGAARVVRARLGQMGLLLSFG